MFQICRLFHSVTCAHLPLTIYKKVLSLLGDKDSAMLSAIFTSTSVHLKVLGTHTLVNSLLSPIIFYTLTRLIFHVQIHEFTPHTEKGTGPKKMPCESEIKERTGTNTVQNGCNGKMKINGIKNNQERNCIKERTYQNSKNTNSQNRNSSSIQNSNVARYRTHESVFCGFTIGVICYIRVDTILFYAVLLISTVPYVHLTTFLQSSFIWISSFAASVLFGGFVDYIDYGTWFVSPIQWAKFNVFSDKATILFAGRHNMYYFEMLFIPKIMSVMQVICICFSLILVMQQKYPHRQLKKTFLSLLMAFLILFAIYGFKSHKELRFLHNVIVLFQMVSGISTAIVLRRLRQWMPNRTSYLLFLHFIITLIITDSWNNFPCYGNPNLNKWKYKNSSISSDLNEAFYFVSQQTDVTGVFCDQSLYDTAAYSLLHKNVPLLIMIHHEFQEFTPAASKRIESGKFLLTMGSIRVSVLNRVSNFFAEERYPYIIKYLRERNYYNYLVIHESNDAFRNGYYTIFSKRHVKVLKLHANEFQTTAYEYNRHTKANSTILEYEGSWLITYGLPQLAVDRLEMGLLNDRSNIRLFQLLAKAYVQLNQTNIAHHVLNQCISIHGAHMCRQKHPAVQLHKDYNSKIDLLF